VVFKAKYCIQRLYGEITDTTRFLVETPVVYV
jgi:hypothetical protein